MSCLSFFTACIGVSSGSPSNIGLGFREWRKKQTHTHFGFEIVRIVQCIFIVEYFCCAIAKLREKNEPTTLLRSARHITYRISCFTILIIKTAIVHAFGVRFFFSTSSHISCGHSISTILMGNCTGPFFPHSILTGFELIFPSNYFAPLNNLTYAFIKNKLFSPQNHCIEQPSSIDFNNLLNSKVWAKCRRKKKTICLISSQQNISSWWKLCLCVCVWA